MRRSPAPLQAAFVLLLLGSVPVRAEVESTLFLEGPSSDHELPSTTPLSLRFEFKQKFEAEAAPFGGHRATRFKGLLGVSGRLSPAWRIGLRLPYTNATAPVDSDQLRTDDVYVNVVHRLAFRPWDFERPFLNLRIYLPTGEEPNSTTGARGSLYASGVLSRVMGRWIGRLTTEGQTWNNTRDSYLRASGKRAGNLNYVVSESAEVERGLIPAVSLMQSAGFTHTWRKPYESEAERTAEFNLITALKAGLGDDAALMFSYRHEANVSRPSVTYSAYRSSESRWLVEYSLVR